MTKRPKRLEVFDEDTLKDLAALQNPSIRGRGTSAGISTRSRSAKVPSIYYVSTMGEEGGGTLCFEWAELDHKGDTSHAHRKLMKRKN